MISDLGLKYNKKVWSCKLQTAVVYNLRTLPRAGGSGIKQQLDLRVKRFQSKQLATLHLGQLYRYDT